MAVEATDVSVPARRRVSCRRVVALDAGWDLLLGIACVVAAVPGGASILGLPPTMGWPVRAVLVVIGIGSVGYSGLLAHSARGEETASAICPPTALANAATAVVLGALVVLLAGTLTSLGTAVVTVAGLGCAAFAGAEWGHAR